MVAQQPEQPVIGAVGVARYPHRHALRAGVVVGAGNGWHAGPALRHQLDVLKPHRPVDAPIRHQADADAGVGPAVPGA